MSVTPSHHVEIVREVLSTHLGRELGPGDDATPLAALGLESFAALAVRRDLGVRTGRMVPLVALLGDRTPADLAGDVDTAADVTSSAGPVVAEGDSFDGAPLTPVQSAYWTGRGDDFALGGLATWWFHSYRRTPADRRVPLADDLDAIDTAWRRIVAHHPMLRAVVGRDGRQRVVVHDVRDLAVERIDLREVADPAAELERVRRDRSHQRRPAHTWPLWDIVHVLMPGDVVETLVGFDVLMIDFTSWTTVMAQWGALVAEPQRDLPAPPAEFLDLVAARPLDPAYAALRERDRAWWAEQELPSGPALPAGPGEGDEPRFARDQIVLDATTWAELRRAATTHGVSPTAVVLGAFAGALSRHGAGSDLCLNLTLQDRPEGLDGGELVVGDFTTTALVPVCGDLLRTGFGDHAREVNRAVWAALDHRSWTGVEEARRRDPGASGSAYPVVFTSALGGPNGACDAWWGERSSGISQTPQVVLDHLVWTEHRDGQECLVLTLDHRVGVVPDTWCAVVLEAEANLLRHLAAGRRWDGPGALWDPLDTVDEPLPTTDAPLLHDPWLAAVDDHPERPAVTCGDESVTQAALHARAAAVARALVEAGVGAGDLVLVALDKSIDQVAAVMGVELVGAGYVPVDPAWPSVRLEAVRRRTGLGVALARSGFEPPEGVRLVAVDTLPDRAEMPATERPRPDELAYVIFTSGSTGEPKGVAIEHRQARTTIDDIDRRFSITAADAVLGVSALSFDLSVHDLFGTMGRGGHVVLPEPARARDPQHWLELIERHRVTVWNSAPPLLEMLVEYAEFHPGAVQALASLRVVLLSGDWIPVTLPDRLRALVPGASVNSLGGATEASIWSITHPIGEVDPAWPSIPYGRGLTDQGFHILDDDGWPVPVGDDGELWISGGGVARGYIGDEEKTAERFVVHPVLGERLYRTGDLGRWRPDGTIEFLGRTDRQVKVRGHRIELGEVEAGLERLDGVRAAVVSSMPGPDGRPRLVAHVALRGGATDEREAGRRLAEALAEQVPDYMVPHRFVLLDALPMTANGKVDHAALANPFERRPKVTSAPAEAKDAPRPAAPQGPAAVLAELVTERPWPTGTLIEAGVPSLGVVRLANAIEDAGHPRPSFAELATRTPVSDLAAQWASSPGSVSERGRLAAETRSVEGEGSSSRFARSESGGEARSDSGGSSSRFARSESGGEVGGLVAHLREVADRLERLDGELAAVRALLRDPRVAATRDVPPRTATPDHPLTEMQLAYLVGRAPDGHGATAPHYYTEALVEDLDVARLQRALDLVVARHPMLRAVITPDTHQRVLDQAEARIEEVDHRGLDAVAQDKERDAIREQRSHRVLPADRAPMLGLLAVRLDERWWRLHLDLDLLFCDAASALVVVHELAGAYADPDGLPPAPAAKFTDHVEASADRSRAEQFWADRLPVLPPTPTLGEVRGQRRFVRRRLEVEATGWDRLQASARADGITTTCLMVDLVAEALRGNGIDDLTLVLTIADRPAGNAGVVGDYTGTVLVPAYAGPVVERRRRLQGDLLACLEHGMGPAGVHGNEVLRRLRESGRPASPTVVVSSALGEAGGDASQLLDVLGTTEYAISQTPGVLLDIQLFEVDGGLRVNWDAVEDALPAGWLDERFARFAASLEAGERTPQAPTQAVTAVLAEVLGRDDLDPDTSFFDLGANSLMLVTAHRRLREIGHEIGVVDLFAHPTIHQVVAHLDGGRPIGPAHRGRVPGHDATDALRAARDRGSRRRQVGRRK